MQLNLIDLRVIKSCFLLGHRVFLAAAGNRNSAIKANSKLKLLIAQVFTVPLTKELLKECPVFLSPQFFMMIFKYTENRDAFLLYV